MARRVSRQPGSESAAEPAASDLDRLPSFNRRAIGLGVGARLRAWLRRRSLDAALAAGADPSDSAVLTYRAASLTAVRSRRKLADWLAKIRSVADSGPRGFSAALQPDRQEVLGAEETLTEIEVLLRSPAPVYAQGVALLKGLLGEGDSCIYASARPGELRETLDRVLAGLRGQNTE